MITTNLFTLAKAKYFGNEYVPVYKADFQYLEIDFKNMIFRTYFCGNRDTSMEIPLYLYDKDLPRRLYIMKKTGEELPLSQVLIDFFTNNFTITEPVWWTSPLSGDANEASFYPEITNELTSLVIYLKRMTISRIDANNSCHSSYLVHFYDIYNNEYETYLEFLIDDYYFRNCSTCSLKSFFDQIDTSLNKIPLTERNPSYE